ncbi:hypothetical protein QZH41_005344 [Actinostola sp. cb2023]|nr:hypothetical protein QZH41_005345 [Actinostola sp. cb2023]KAK3748620.1 hypothetical protein QZH41_005344 [Actinostola sp. cb2023]
MQGTHFTRKEIEDWYHGFMKSCPNGAVSLKDFQHMYAQFFDGDASEFAMHVFRSFDVDKSGMIDFKEFMQSLSMTSRGNLDEKLEWAFRIYDIDGDGKISQGEMLEIIKCLYKLYPRKNWSSKATPKERTEMIFRKFNINNDGFLSMDEFKIGAIEDPVLVAIMQSNSSKSARSDVESD